MPTATVAITLGPEGTVVVVVEDVVVVVVGGGVGGGATHADATNPQTATPTVTSINLNRIAIPFRPFQHGRTGSGAGQGRASA